EGCSFREDGFGSAREEYTGQSSGCAGSGSNACPHTWMPGYAPADGSDGSSGGGGFADLLGIGAFAAFTFNFAFGFVQFLGGAAIESAHAGAEITRDAVWQRQGIEAYIN